MTDPRRRRFSPYVRQLADLLALRDWTFEVYDDAPADPDAIASIWCVNGRKRAKLRLSDDFLGMTPEEQRLSLTHELIHCHMEPGRQAAFDELPDAAKSGFMRLHETGIDGLADGLAPLLPLPGEAKPDETVKRFAREMNLATGCPPTCDCRGHCQFSPRGDRPWGCKQLPTDPKILAEIGNPNPCGCDLCRRERRDNPAPTNGTVTG